MKNSILVLHPYKFHGQWVFDDDATGLVREAFIAGIDVIIDRMTSEIKNTDKGFTLLFSSEPFPGNRLRIDWLREESGGNWYWCQKYEQEGWLCPALFKYFDAAPKHIYSQAIGVSS